MFPCRALGVPAPEVGAFTGAYLSEVPAAWRVPCLLGDACLVPVGRALSTTRPVALLLCSVSNPGAPSPRCFGSFGAESSLLPLLYSSVSSWGCRRADHSLAHSCDVRIGFTMTNRGYGVAGRQLEFL